MNFISKSKKIAVIGLGYVGLPLALEFAKQYKVIGYDIDEIRINSLGELVDLTCQVAKSDLKDSLLTDINQNTIGLFLTFYDYFLSDADIFIVTVPTPVDNFKKPDLTQLLFACKTIGKKLKIGDIVIFESTVYPGCTEEDCVPVLEAFSGLVFNKDFFVGYSPERINPSDKIHTLTTVIKVTSGSNPEVAIEVDNLYKSIISAGTHLAPSIKVAEASKAIENAQRDINISFVNEMALIFDRMNIDTQDVLDAAETKYNFLKFKPGLVGGHCISVDPYYLAHKATQLGYQPQVILSGRKVNDIMPYFIAEKLVKLIKQKGKFITKSTKALILGITFKENCPDVRNTKVMDIYNELKKFGLEVDIFDPLADYHIVDKELNIKLLKKLSPKCNYDAVLIAVAHEVFKNINFNNFKLKGTVIFDVKGFLDCNIVDARL